MAQLTVQNIRDYVRNFIQVTSDDLPDTLIDSWTQEAYDDLVGHDIRWPWFEFGGQDAANNYTINLVSGQQNYPLPPIVVQGYSCPVDPKKILAVAGQHWELTYIGQTMLEETFPKAFVTNTNEPTAWSEWGQTGITVWPVPIVSSYQILLRGYREPVDFVSLGAGGVIDGPNEFGTAIQQYALSNGWAQQSDLQQAAYWMQNYIAAQDRIQRKYMSAPLAEGLVLNGGRVIRDTPPRLRFPFDAISGWGE